ncbi:PqiA/YebS family transporter subunit [Bordetella sp. 15P40C-2]|nr:PqiA/YebS family transporter subunit [Bordetella sp. 15P40C-2]MVW70605.1 PqiA/YebS family transporter subunit [Bordetella sp. 15P40C-2]
MSTPPEPLIACEHCGAIFRRHMLQRGERALCDRCGTTLWRYSGITLSGWLALCLAALICFTVANIYPVVSMSVGGMTRQASMLDAVGMTWDQGYYATALMTGLSGFGVPLVQLLLLLWVLGPLTFGREPPGFAGVVRAYGLLRPWSMVSVFLLGVLVAVVKLAGMASVSPEPGLFAFGALTVLITMLDRLSPHALWRFAEHSAIVPVHVPKRVPGRALTGCHVCGQVQAVRPNRATPGNIEEEIDELLDDTPHCVRCDAVLHERKPASLTRTWALLIAAAALYVPANVLPIMNIRSVIFGDSGHTILGGVVELWQTGSWDIAVIVFVASIVVPLTKMLALAVLATSLQSGSQFTLRQRTRMYEMIEFIGQWSMLDVFVVILLAALAQFEGFLQISAGPAAGSFGMVVILTMLSAMSFDPRIAWDKELSREFGNVSPEPQARRLRQSAPDESRDGGSVAVSTNSVRDSA